MAYWIVRALTWLLIRTQMQLDVEGIEHIPRSGPILLVSNHLGPADHFAICVRIPRKVRILAKAEIFEWPVLGWIARQAGTVRIRRGESDRDALRIASRLLAQGECLLVFPEGTYSHPPEPVGMLPLKPGAAWLALRSRATVVPLALFGAEQVWAVARGWRLGRRPACALSSASLSARLSRLERATKANRRNDRRDGPSHRRAAATRLSRVLR